MLSIRPDVRAFKKAVEKLLSSDTDNHPLSDHEMEQVGDCLTRVEKALQDGEIVQDRRVLPSTWEK